MPRLTQQLATTDRPRSQTYVIPFDNIGATVFVAELVSQLRSRNIDLDRLAAYRSRNEGTNLQQKEATQQMAKDIAQQVQSGLPSTTVADPTSQQRILELETELAKAKAAQGTLLPLQIRRAPQVHQAWLPSYKDAPPRL